MKTFKTALISLGKWIAISIVIGLSVGFVSSIFSKSITMVTKFRLEHPWMLLGLPAAGLLTVFLYKAAGREGDHGTNTVIEAVRTQKPIPLVVTPLIVISTMLTHLFGGSAGREGAALQLGGSMASFTAEKLHMNESDAEIMIMAGMSAAFAALFGTPIAATILPMEFVSVGVLYYAALVPCVLSAFIAHSLAVYLKAATLQAPYAVTDVPSLYSLAFPKVIILGIACAVVGIFFCISLHFCSTNFQKWIKNPYLRIAAGGAAVVLLALLLHTQDYCGVGREVILESFQGTAPPYAFILKIVFTCLTLCAGYKGGEIVPSFFIGASLGCLMSGFLGMPADICTACGMCGVFCAVTNSPISSILIALELFGGSGMGFFALCIAVSYMLSGYYSVFSAQKIVYSKTEARFIDRVSGDSFKRLEK